MPSLKRKPSTQQHKSRKRVTADGLKWKSVEVRNADFEQDLLGLEEVEGVTIEFSKDGTNTAHFIVDAETSSETGDEDENEEWVPLCDQPGFLEEHAAEASTSKSPINIDDSQFQKSLLPAYTHLHLSNAMRHCIHKLGFKNPTAIQSAAWKVALNADHSIAPRDIVGVAETGSGKTLAYGVPILQHILSQLLRQESPLKSPAALILTPTRELAMQVKDHLLKLVNHALLDEKARSPISIITLTGGMSIQKQRRQLSNGAHIIVATPGRLWDLIQETAEFADRISELDYLVLDEADRMLEGGHYAELTNIFKLTNHSEVTVEDEFETAETQVKKHKEPNPNMRTYIFSATMSRELQRNLKRPKQKRKRLSEGEKGKLGALAEVLDRLDFRDKDPAIIDLLGESGVVSTVKECALECLATDKDVQLYHFLLLYPGKTIVFLSSVDGIRRLHPIFSHLELGHVGILHSSMQQKARIKAIERFQKADKAVLLATDVAARGLDIPKVDHIVHFQLPRSSDTYIHRSGRTGRAGQTGVALQLVAPEEKGLQRELMQTLSKDVKSLPTLDVEWSVIEQLKRRIDLAKQIDQAQHKLTKQNHEEKWLQEAADAMEIQLSDDSDAQSRKSSKKRSYNARTSAIKAELSMELKRPLMIRGISARYVTAGKGGQDKFVDSLLENKQHEHLIGLTKKEAYHDISTSQPLDAQRKRAKGRNT